MLTGRGSLHEPQIFSGLEDWPVLLRERPKQAGDACKAIPINSEEGCKFESELFSGKVVFYATGLPSSPAGLFSGKKRKSWLMVQGSFKEDVSVDEVLTGHHFVRPLRNLPMRWILRGLIALTQRLSPSMRISNTPVPFILSPLGSTANCIHIAECSRAPPLSPAAEPVEDMRLLSSVLTMPAEKRREWMLRASYMAGLTFRPGPIYTFHFYQHLLDISNFRLHMPVMTFNLLDVLNGQPLQLMALRLSDGKVLWDFELWHAKLLSR